MVSAMRHTEEEIERARMHVWDAESCVARQRRLIAELERDGHSTERAGHLLKTMEDLLVLFRRHLEDMTMGAKPD